MAKFNDKISNLISSQLPDFVVEDHPKFLQFLKTYYTFMESAELQISDVQVTDGILLETETNQENRLLLDGGALGSEKTQLHAGSKLLLENSEYGKFTKGEIIRGQTSKAESSIIVEDVLNGRLYIASQDKFIQGEQIIGLTSNAIANIINYKPNPVQNIQQLLNFRDPDKTISFFLDKFRDEFLKTIPEKLSLNLNKRNLIKNIKSFYRLKGTKKGHEIFFKVLFNEESDTIYPRENILRVSDGKWNIKKIMRVIDNVGNTNDLIGRTITGLNSNATAIIENVFKYTYGGIRVSEFILNVDSIEGDFEISETIQGTASDVDDVFIKANITGLPSEIDITDGGSLNSINDTVTLSGGGQGALFSLDSIGSGSIEEIIIENQGYDFDIGDRLVFDNTGTNGAGAEAFVRIVNGGFHMEIGSVEAETLYSDKNIYPDGPIVTYKDNTFNSLDSTVYTKSDLEVGSVMLGLTSGATATIRTLGSTENDFYAIYLDDSVGDFIQGEIIQITKTDSSVFTIQLSEILGDEDSAITTSYWQDLRTLGNDTNFENRIILEDATTSGDLYSGNILVQETNTGVKDITDVFIISGGLGYKSLPSISISPISSGKDGIFKCYGQDIGKVLKIKNLEPGIKHELSPSPPSFNFFKNILITSPTGNFNVGETVVGLSSSFTGIVVSYDTQTGILKIKDFSGEPQINEFIQGQTLGSLASVHVSGQTSASVNVNSIIDTDGSYLNQDGHVSENTMKIQDSLYYQDFSYVLKVGRSINEWRDSFKKTIHAAGFYYTGLMAIQSRLNLQVKSPVVGEISGVLDVPIYSIINTLFETVFARRLGTITDGTSLNSSPLLGQKGKFDENARELTLTSKSGISSYLSRVRGNVANLAYVKQGFVYAGPSWGSLNRFANTVYGISSVNSHITFEVLGNLKIFGTKTSLDGQEAIFKATSDYYGQKLKSNFAFPTKISTNVNTFDSEIIYFDDTTRTFDFSI
jgi:hypothetical protein